MDKRYQVFISSTFTDLQDVRQDVTRKLIDCGCFPAGMEAFPATDEQQFNYIKPIIDQSDYVVVISAGRYGAVDGQTKRSYTEREFDYARAAGKPILALLHRNPDALPRDQCEQTERGQRALKAFREKLRSSRVIKEWDDPKELGRHIADALDHAKTRFPASGWVRLPPTAIPPEVQAPHTSDRGHGRYTRDQCGKYIGFFYAYRRAFRTPQDLDRSLFEFAWSEERSTLLFNERQTYPSAKGLEVRVHKGDAYFSDLTPLMHLLTTDNGTLRLLTLTKISLDTGKMRGIMLSQIPRGSGYQPSVSPIILHRQDRAETREALEKSIGSIQPGSPEYAGADKDLLEVEQEIGVFALAPRHAAPEESSRPLLGEAQSEIRPPLKH